ncbi:MAG TPA: helix-hairpin-helix domain-containing protein [Acidimicrobiales bacterium]|nr:helix-hairpin-helix domain-containing protein [Acidimicrobiales bacterium]
MSPRPVATDDRDPFDLAGGPADHPVPPEELLRPLPPRTWRDRLDDLAASGWRPAQVGAVLLVLAVTGVLGWRAVAAPPAPPEVDIPFAPGVADPTGATTDGAVPPASAAGGTVSGSEHPADLAAGGGAPAAGVVVHVAGAVATPGVQRLPVGARVADAVEAAGGAAPDADLARINLAAPLVDGQQVYVLRRGEEAPPAVPAVPGAGAPPGGPTGGGSGPGAPIDVNAADAAALEELPGIGPATAQAIVEHRERHGPFRTVDDLIDVRGIGEAKLARIRDLVTV